MFGWTYWVPMLVAGVLLTAALALVVWPLALIAAILTLAAMAFFRDPPRQVPQEQRIMVAPADGTVTDITPMPAHGLLGADGLRVGIFLSVLDVHINRSPCPATVLATHFEDGQFLDARHPDCGVLNQSNTLVLGDASAAAQQPIAVLRQVVGAIARRIICPLAPGDAVAQGQRIGMIAFGSRTELIVPNPAAWEVLVKPGQRVKGGRDILLRRTHP